MIENPFETKSDSFYFVNGSLIMHNKASYKVRYFDSNAGCILCLCYCCALAKQSMLQSNRITSKYFEKSIVLSLATPFDCPYIST
jgi:GMP-PDE, delta subunit